MDEVQVAVPPLSPVVPAEADNVEVVLAPADAEPEDEPAAGKPVHARRLLGQEDGVARRAEQDVREQADPLGHRGRRGQRGQGLVAGEGDAVDRGEGREARRVRAPRELDQVGPARLADAVGQPDADLHQSSSPMLR